LPWNDDFGQQNTEAEGHAQMDYALENGVNFFDTAEMYSIPANKDTRKYRENYRNLKNQAKEKLLASKIGTQS
jgi:aryl-alcohol dehydrogenase-like predicted oxidoreductase